VTDVLPDRARHAAKDLGLLNIANTLPQVIAPLAAPAILQVSRGDYTLLFAVAGAVAIVGSVFLLPLKTSARPRKVPTLSFWYTSKLQAESVSYN